MKTPIQQIYDHLKATKEGRGYGAEYCIDWLLEFESKMLDKEKELLEDAFYEGKEVEYQFHVNCLTQDTFETYYNKTFNAK